MARDEKSSYYDEGGIETLDIIKAKLTPEEYRGFLKGSALKYLCRAAFKGDEARDLEKAANYARWLNDEEAMAVSRMELRWKETITGQTGVMRVPADLAEPSYKRYTMPVCGHCEEEGHVAMNCPDIQEDEDESTEERIRRKEQERTREGALVDPENPEPGLFCMQRKTETLPGGVKTWCCDLCHKSGVGEPMVTPCIKGREQR